ncbi:hypothetical protein DICVIV_02391 [Dictyocaulus viviparus]|uniref:G-protein coupled receptors family 1 profile domain-containing protein n=1 Tax=Dictyocaulus viviparus TaxID=29172 RepID=A0A0D8Y5B2_DICVI|nr:hypothetical protein DICVIV_02391 [Dictyocaulus viviparus]
MTYFAIEIAILLIQFYGIATLPYSIYLAVSWNPVYFNLNPYFVIISSAPFIIQLKIYLTLTTSIAVERILAIYFPITFRMWSTSSYPEICLFFGIILGVMDFIMEIPLSTIKNVPNCLAVGCFMSEKFLYYWGITNMLMGIMVIVLTTSILLKLRFIQRQSNSKVIIAFSSTENQFKQANRTCVGILIISITFVTIPSVIVGLIEMVVVSTFGILGPYYFVGLLCAGACNSVIHVVFNSEMRSLAYNTFCQNRVIDFILTMTAKIISRVHLRCNSQ